MGQVNAVMLKPSKSQEPSLINNFRVPDLRLRSVNLKKRNTSLSSIASE